MVGLVGIWLFGCFMISRRKTRAVCVFRFLVLSLPGGILDSSYRDDEMG